MSFRPKHAAPTPAPGKPRLEEVLWSRLHRDLDRLQVDDVGAKTRAGRQTAPSTGPRPTIDKKKKQAAKEVEADENEGYSLRKMFSEWTTHSKESATEWYGWWREKLALRNQMPNDLSSEGKAKFLENVTTINEAFHKESTGAAAQIAIRIKASQPELLQMHSVDKSRVDAFVKEMVGMLGSSKAGEDTGFDEIIVLKNNPCAIEALLAAEDPVLALILQLGSSHDGKRRNAERVIKSAHPEEVKAITEASVFTKSKSAYMQRVRNNLKASDEEVQTGEPLEDLCMFTDKLLVTGELDKVQLHVQDGIRRYYNGLQFLYNVLEGEPKGMKNSSSVALAPTASLDLRMHPEDSPAATPSAVGDQLHENWRFAGKVYVISDEDTEQMKADPRTGGYLDLGMREKTCRMWELYIRMLKQSSSAYPASRLHRLLDMRVPFDPRAANLGGDFILADETVPMWQFVRSHMIKDEWPDQDLVREFGRTMKRIFSNPMRGAPGGPNGGNPERMIGAYLINQGEIKINPRPNTPALQQRTYNACKEYVKHVMYCVDWLPNQGGAGPEYSWFGRSALAPAVLSAFMMSIANEGDERFQNVVPPLADDGGPAMGANPPGRQNRNNARMRIGRAQRALAGQDGEEQQAAAGRNAANARMAATGTLDGWWSWAWRNSLTAAKFGAIAWVPGATFLMGRAIRYGTATELGMMFTSLYSLASGLIVMALTIVLGPLAWSVVAAGGALTGGAAMGAAVAQILWVYGISQYMRVANANGDTRIGRWRDIVRDWWRGDRR